MCLKKKKKKVFCFFLAGTAHVWNVYCSQQVHVTCLALRLRPPRSPLLLSIEVMRSDEKTHIAKPPDSLTEIMRSDEERSPLVWGRGRGWNDRCSADAGQQPIDRRGQSWGTGRFKQTTQMRRVRSMSSASAQFLQLTAWTKSRPFAASVSDGFLFQFAIANYYLGHKKVYRFRHFFSARTCRAISFSPFILGPLAWETEALCSARGPLVGEYWAAGSRVSESSSSTFLVRGVKGLIREALSSLTTGIISVRCASYMRSPSMFQHKCIPSLKGSRSTVFSPLQIKMSIHLFHFFFFSLKCCRPSWHRPFHMHKTGWLPWVT